MPKKEKTPPSANWRSEVFSLVDPLCTGACPSETLVKEGKTYLALVKEIYNSLILPVSKVEN